MTPARMMRAYDAMERSARQRSGALLPGSRTPDQVTRDGAVFDLRHARWARRQLIPLVSAEVCSAAEQS